jgi:DNA processing protein
MAGCGWVERLMGATKNSELAYLNALNLLTILGPRRIVALMENYDSAEDAWKAPAAELFHLLGLQDPVSKFEKERSVIEPEKEWEKLIKQKVSCVSSACPSYPRLLKELHFPPPLLYYKGNLDRIDKPAVAIVGSRRCTFYGQEVAHRLAVELATAGVSVISGMALGIDTAAHRGTLENSGYTAAVLGCGVDQCYPPKNADLMQLIIAEGAVISEYPVDTEPLPFHFPLRNRVISGLSLGTVVVEATAKSGALITANYALEQNREVFAVPGNVGSPYSRGSHRLIKEGARLVESAADILEELNFQTATEEQLTLAGAGLLPDLSAVEKKLLDMIPYQPMHIDNIIQQSGVKASETSALLLSLELKKLIRQTPGKYFMRV